MDLNDLKQLIELFSNSNVDRLDLTQEGVSLKLAKKQAKIVTGSTAISPASLPAPAPASAEPEVEPEDDLSYVTSPIVGTFYRSPNPTASAFVEIGEQVKVGQTLCIVEAMKLMNEIQADQAGTVVKVYAENGEGVEYGQKLFGLKPL